MKKIQLRNFAKICYFVSLYNILEILPLCKSSRLNIPFNYLTKSFKSNKHTISKKQYIKYMQNLTKENVMVQYINVRNVNIK